jgi:hypothetical protein
MTDVWIYAENGYSALFNVTGGGTIHRFKTVRDDQEPQKSPNCGRET